MTKEQRLADLHQEAKIEFDAIQSVMRDERMQCLDDRRFYSIAGAQWEGGLEEQYRNKPKIEVNKIHLSVMRIINEYRNNRITVDFVSKTGDENDDLADVCDGLFRADEQDSVADEAYDNAFEEAVGGGFGAFRLRAEFEDEYDEENEHQRIRIEPIYDADSTVFWDLDAKRQDKSDARVCYVLTAMSPEAYKEQWNDDPASWPKDVQRTEFDWSAADVVYIAELYRVEESSELLRIFSTMDGVEEKYTERDFIEDPELEETLLAIGTVEVRQRKLKRRRVRKYIMSGGKILEDAGYIAGDQIPVIPVYGKRWFVDNIERCMGHVRLAKDAQRLKNMQLSKLAELAALTAIEKPIFTPEQVAGHEMMWAEDNLKNWPYMLLNTVTDANGQEVMAGPVGYTKPPQIPPALGGLLQLTDQDMQDLLGKQEAGEEVMSNISGKAIELVQQRLDMQSYIYMSNMSKAVKRCGEVWLSMARDIMIEPGRKMKAVGLGGEIEGIELGRPRLNEKTGAVEYENDLRTAKYDVAVDVGPTSSTKRQATVRNLMTMVQLSADPETQQVLTSMAMMNMEGEGIQDVRKYFRSRLIKMGVIEPTDQEAEKLLQEMQAMQQPDPNAIYLQAAAKEAEAKAVKAQADTEYTMARAAETRAKTVETLAGINQKERATVVNTAKTLSDVISARNAATTQPQQMGEIERGL